MIAFFGEITEFYTYRSANVVNMNIHIIPSQAEIDYFGKFLKKHGYQLDNHICIKFSNGIAMRYSDGSFLIGTKIEVGYW